MSAYGNLCVIYPHGSCPMCCWLSTIQEDVKNVTWLKQMCQQNGQLFLNWQRKYKMRNRFWLSRQSPAASFSSRTSSSSSESSTSFAQIFVKMAVNLILVSLFCLWLLTDASPLVKFYCLLYSLVPHKINLIRCYCCFKKGRPYRESYAATYIILIILINLNLLIHF